MSIAIAKGQLHAQVLWSVTPFLLQQLGFPRLLLLAALTSLAASISAFAYHKVFGKRRLWASHGATPAVLGMLACAYMTQQQQGVSQHLGSFQGHDITPLRCDTAAYQLLLAAIRLSHCCWHSKCCQSSLECSNTDTISGLITQAQMSSVMQASYQPNSGLTKHVEAAACRQHLLLQLTCKHARQLSCNR